jgi:hypothetical protein
MSETDTVTHLVNRKLVHIKVRPTYANINNLLVYLKNLGYQDIPKIHSENCYINKEAINTFCDKIQEIIKYEPNSCDKKKNHTSKEVFMFQESSLLPKNVYVSEKDNEEKLEDNFVDNDISSVSESENSENSEKEDHPEEEGYEFYAEVSEDEFSE